MVTRYIDKLGRATLPMQLRKELGITTETLISIECEDDKIIIKRAEERCVLCGTIETLLVAFKEKHICTNCIQRLKEQEVKMSENI